MQLTMSAELDVFRREVKDFLAEQLPRALSGRIDRISLPTPDEDGMAWLGVLAKKGWSVPHWPVEHGGTGWSPLQHFIFQEECHSADAPVPAWQGIHMCAPVLIAYGTEDQKRRFLEPMRTGEHLWAQGFSEPGSGSDLASARTSAVRVGDHYVVNGQKIWTSGAYHSDWGFFLVRTGSDVKPQLGLSFLLIDMKTPGLTVRRIPQINGDAHLCEVFLDDVKVPAENLVGEEGKGWSYSKFLLDHERTASSFIHWNKRELKRARDMARLQHRDGRPLIEERAIRDRLLRLEAELDALEWSVLRVLAHENFQHHITAVSSSLKVRGSLLQQAVTELHMDLLGRQSLREFDYAGILDGSTAPSPAWPGYLEGRTSVYLYARAATIFGGALQVQKNIIAKLAFGL